VSKGEAMTRGYVLGHVPLRAVLGAVMWGAAAVTFGNLGQAQRVEVDLAGYARSCGVDIRRAGSTLAATWPVGNGESGQVSLNLQPGGPLIHSLGLKGSEGAPPEPLLREIDPAFLLTVGTRSAPEGRPPDMSIWNTFFDKPATRPYRTYASRLDLRQARVTSHGRRATIALGDVTIGPFSGELVFTLYPGSRLAHVEAVVTTQEDRRAVLYDAGLVGDSPGWRHIAWMDTEGRIQGLSAEPEVGDRPIAVRHRAIIAEGERGSVACFPPPHQFQFPRDLTDNYRFAWAGRGHGGQTLPFGYGVRQDPEGGGAFVPWFNAPPGTKQRLGVFYLLNRGPAADALRETLRYTNGDRFPTLPGYRTFTSHWHMAVAVTAMQQRSRGVDPLPAPEFVRVFKDMGVNAVHLAEFHGDGHQRDPGPLRLPEMEAMFSECRRLSEDRFLLIPGEEISGILGIEQPGRHPGHWMSLFPHPVRWIQQRSAGQPFQQSEAPYGTVYRVGGRQDMVELLRREHGLGWVAHPRIKASSWTPDIFRNEEFFKSDFWLGAAWKAMPADLSRPRLGERALDLLSDMANWGERKDMPGEVDVFKVDHTHELYGHMNINYLRLAQLPRYEDGWQSILDALRGGRFFVTTGEVLIRDFTVGGRLSGETLRLDRAARPEVRVNLQWTYPLRFAEIVSGDGNRVYRQTIDLSDTAPFGTRTLTFRQDLSGRKWVRFEVWDVATNGAFTQPVWLADGPPR
jgi:hypothetical protein